MYTEYSGTWKVVDDKDFHFYSFLEKELKHITDIDNSTLVHYAVQKDGSVIYFYPKVYLYDIEDKLFIKAWQIPCVIEIFHLDGSLHQVVVLASSFGGKAKRFSSREEYQNFLLLG